MLDVIPNVFSLSNADNEIRITELFRTVRFANKDDVKKLIWNTECFCVNVLSVVVGHAPTCRRKHCQEGNQ